MSIVKTEDSKKWINSFIAIISVIAGYVTIRFVEQLGEWFDLEARIPNFLLTTQGVGILVGVVVFLSIFKNKNASNHLNEVYAELVKVVWPDKDSILKMTMGLVVALSIVSGFFVLVDFLFREFLQLLY